MHLVVLERRQADPARLGELEHEHRQRPRRRERAALDRDDLREVGVGEAADLERAGGAVIAGGVRRRARAGSREEVRRGRLDSLPHPAGIRARRGGDGRRPRRAGRAPRPPRAEPLKRTAPSPTASGAPGSARPVQRAPPGESAAAGSTERPAAPRGGERLAAPRVEHGEHERRVRSAPGASASSELTPTSGSPRPCASARAVAMPIRSPVKLPGPTPTAIRSTSSQPTPGRRQRLLRRAQQPAACAGPLAGLRVVAHLERPSPTRRGRPPPSAVVAVSSPRTITRRQPPPVAARVGERDVAHDPPLAEQRVEPARARATPRT